MALDTTSNDLTGQDTDVASAHLVPNSIVDTALGLSWAELKYFANNSSYSYSYSYKTLDGLVVPDTRLDRICEPDLTSPGAFCLMLILARLSVRLQTALSTPA